MKSFTEYLTEDKKRFILKNKNLTTTQAREIIDYFKANRQAEKKVDWNKSDSMSYEDFENIMMQSKMGRKKKLKCSAIKVKGLVAGDDYVHVIMKTKEYCAYIPLNFNAAQKFNTRELGVCSGPWCIGHSGTPYHWNEEVIEEEQIPVYVVNTHSKWVVMIKEGNRKYNIWAIENKPSKVREGIPNFSVRKELLNPAQKKMYDEIRDDYFRDREVIEIDIDDAVVDYDQLIEDIDEAKDKWESAYDEFHDEIYRIKRDTKNSYNEEIDEIISSIDEIDERLEYYEDLSNEEAEEDPEDESEFWRDEEGNRITEDEIDDAVSELESDKEQYESDRYGLEQQLEKIDELDYYEMEDSDIDWSDYVPSEENMHDEVNIPYLSEGKYSDYIDLLEEHAGWSARYNGDRAQADINSYIMEDSGGDVEVMLADNEMHHPETIQEMANEI